MKVEILKFKEIDKNSIKKLLIIKLRAIGDVLLSTPVIENLRNYFPDARIDFLTEPQSSQILEGNPFLNNIILFGRKQKGFISFLNKLRKEKYDIVFDLFCNPRSAQITYFSRARYRVGYAFKLRKYAYNILLKSRSDEVHNIDFNLDTLRALDIKTEKQLPYFPIGQKEEEMAERFFKSKFNGSKLIVGINTGGGWESKLWGFHKFAELCDKLIERLDARILLFWGPNQEYIYERIKELMHYDLIIAPPTTLKEMASLHKRCSFVVSNDSGPMHIAAAVGTPTLGIFGPTSPFHQGPVAENCTTIVKKEISCLGCNLTKCNIGNLCMSELTVNEVFDKIIEWQNIKIGK
jgi:lipopolysaccharide heptosyltransferase II